MEDAPGQSVKLDVRGLCVRLARAEILEQVLPLMEINRPTPPLLCADLACFLSCDLLSCDLQMPSPLPHQMLGHAMAQRKPRALCLNISAANLIA